MSIFSSVWQQEQLEGLSARLLLLGTWKSRLDKVSTEIQGLSSTHCNFQGLSRPWIFILKIQGLCANFVCKPCFALLRLFYFKVLRKLVRIPKGHFNNNRMKLIDIHCRGSWITCNKTLITLLVVIWQDLAKLLWDSVQSFSMIIFVNLQTLVILSISLKFK